MWISKKKYAEKLLETIHEQRQNARLNDMMEDIWEIKDDIRELKTRINNLEKKK